MTCAYKAEIIYSKETQIFKWNKEVEGLKLPCAKPKRQACTLGCTSFRPNSLSVSAKKNNETGNSLNAVEREPVSTRVLTWAKRAANRNNVKSLALQNINCHISRHFNILSPVIKHTGAFLCLMSKWLAIWLAFTDSFLNWHKCKLNVWLYAVRRRMHLKPYFKSYWYLEKPILKFSILMKCFRKPIAFRQSPFWVYSWII